MAANNLVNTKMEVIGAMVQRELSTGVSVLPYIMDHSNLTVKGADSVSIPKLSSFTVQQRTLGQKVAENAPLTDGVDNIPLDQHPIVYWGYDSHDEKQSTINYMEASIKRASSAHLRNINSLIYAGMTAAAGLSLGGGNMDLTKILDGREYLLGNEADPTRMAILVGADQERSIIEIPQFSEYQYRGDGTAPVVNGVIGKVYSIPVVLLTDIPAGEAYMLDKEGYGFAIQNEAAVGMADDLAYGTGGKELAADMDWGHGVLQEGQKGAAAGTSPFLVKLSL